MDVQLLLRTFVLIFVAELGDKTQLATMAIAASEEQKWTVFGASAAALVATSALGVLLGGWLGSRVDPVWVQRAAGMLFIVIGVYYLWSSRPNSLS